MPDDYPATDARTECDYAPKRYLIDLDKCTRPNKKYKEAFYPWKAFQAHISRCIDDPEKRPASFKGTPLKVGETPIERGHCGCRDCSGNHTVGEYVPRYMIRRHKAFRYVDEEGTPYGLADLRDKNQKLHQARRLDGDDLLKQDED